MYEVNSTRFGKIYGVVFLTYIFVLGGALIATSLAVEIILELK